VIALVARVGRLLAAHWPALLAWYLFGVLGNYLAIQVAGFVGAYSSVAGFALLSLAVLTPLIGFVAMFLTLRDGMPQLSALAPLPEDAATRRRQFIDALLGGILPFFAVYAAWGYLRDDVSAYLLRALQQQDYERWRALADGVTYDVSELPGSIGFTPAALAVLVGAYAGRWALKRYRARLPRWSSFLAVYLEAVWVLIAVQLISQALGVVQGWVDSRQAMVWLTELRAGVGSLFVPLAWIWDGVEWFLGEAGGLILQPLAWLTIAGVIFGQAVAAQAPRLGGAAVDRVRARYGTVPERLRRRMGDIWAELTGRFRPIGRAIVLMWRSGPLLIGGYVLLYTLVQAAEGWGRVGLTRIIGPHDIATFWQVADVVILLLVPLIIEPVRIALVAGSYDATIGELKKADAAGSLQIDDEAHEPGVPVRQVDIEGERPFRVEREHEEGGDALPVHPV
jgi:hypothetical protein